MITALFDRTRRVPDRDALARAFQRCFATPDGIRVLEHLHRHFLFRRSDPRLSAAELRVLEGQRQAVLYICALASGPEATPTDRSSPNR